MQLTFQTFDLKLAHTWAIARTSGVDIFQVVVLELRSSDGVVGRGEASPVARYHESVATVAAFLQKVDARGLSFSDVPGSMAYLETVAPGNMSAKCAINIALLDGAAKKTRKPIHDLLGLGFRDRHHVTSFTIGIDKPDVIRKKVEQAGDFPVLKMKVGVEGDRENLEALREAAPDKWIRVDANEGWRTKEHALEMIQWLALDGHVQFVEQPMHSTAPARDWQWLKERSPLPIFADESYHTARDIPHVAKCFHGVNVKLVKSGGVSAAVEALGAARKAGLKTMIGCMIETSILISAAAHLAELCDFLDVDGNILITNDPYHGVTAGQGMLSFAAAHEPHGLRVTPR
jgi:L-alanine-DL-glutamate epimerase-like enolase superfamily enzyme